MAIEDHKDANSYIREVLATHAARLNRRRWPWPFALPFYDVFSGGLAWTDEVNWLRLDPDVTNLLRTLWAYRTSLMLGKPHEDDAMLAELWRMTQQQCPRWRVFRPGRRTATRRLLRIYRAGHVSARKCLRDMERETERESRGAGDA